MLKQYLVCYFLLRHVLWRDLYDKMVALDPSAPSPEEQETQAITKMRYMQVGWLRPCLNNIWFATSCWDTVLWRDLYDKIVALDPSAPSPEEQETQAITKMRYMQVGWLGDLRSLST